MAIHTSLSLFSGGGGLDLGITLAVPEIRVLCYVEREAYAAAVLASRMEEGSLAPAPVWSDVSTFNGLLWRGSVDLVCGGFPCQDISNAGKRAGIDGERSGLWFEYARIVSEVQPRFVFIENVAALKTRGLDRVLESLASLGFDAEWDCFRASDVGAPHKRERIFILAHSDRDDVQQQSGRRGWTGGADSAESALDQQTLVWPPCPADRDGWAELLRLSPDLEPAICRGTHGVAGGLESRADRLRLLGNGVVPQVAALAFRTLYERLIR